MTGFAEVGATRSMGWVEQLLGEDGLNTLDMRCIRLLERIWLKNGGASRETVSRWCNDYVAQRVVIHSFTVMLRAGATSIVMRRP